MVSIMVKMSWLAVLAFISQIWPLTTNQLPRFKESTSNYACLLKARRLSYDQVVMVGWQHTDNAENQRQEIVVKEVLLQYLFAQARKEWPKAKILFISTGSKQETDQLLPRFAKYPISVKPESNCKMGTKKHYIMDKATEVEGIRVFSNKIKWVTDQKVNVRGGYSHDPKGGMVTTFLLEKVDGTWKVIGQVGSMKRA